MEDLFDFVGMFQRHSAPVKGKTIELMAGGNKTLTDPTMMMSNFVDFAIDLFTFNGSGVEALPQYIERILSVESENPAFWEVLCRWADEMRKHGGVFDYFGYIYEADVISGYKASRLGQFFTPYSVSALLARLTSVGQSYESQDRVSVYDCCCGSSRLLLAAYDELVNVKRVKDKPIILVGGDIDLLSVKMSSLNAMMSGAFALYVCQDALTLNPPSVACVVNSTNFPRTSGIYSLQWMTEDINQYADYIDEEGNKHTNGSKWTDMQVYKYYHFDELLNSVPEE